jgi:hypothetical protein
MSTKKLQDLAAKTEPVGADQALILDSEDSEPNRSKRVTLANVLVGGSAADPRVPRTRRTDTAATWTSENPTLLAGEVGYESDTGRYKVGDGTTAWTGLGYTNTTSVYTPNYATGQWAVPSVLSFANQGAAVGRAVYTPWFVSDTVSIDRIAMQVVTGQADAVCRIGVYPSSNGAPVASLIEDFGTVDADAPGVKELAVDLTLEPGLYYICGVAQGSASNPTFRGGLPLVRPSAGTATTALDGTISGAFRGSSGVSGTLPSTPQLVDTVLSPLAYAFAVRFA